MKDYPLNAEILQMDDDFVRLQNMIGKTLKVTTVKSFDFTIYDPETRSSKKDESGEFILRPERVPIFEEIK